LATGPAANERTRAQRLGVEGQMALFGRHRCLALVKHAHVAPRGNAPMTNSVGEPRCQRSKGLPKPTEKRSTFTPQATATR
jgi:hypothetical protein